MTERSQKFAVFDVDGTLYSLRSASGGEAVFHDNSLFHDTITQRRRSFFDKTFGAQAEDIFRDITAKYPGRTSIGLSIHHNIPESDYYNTIWDLEPADFISEDPKLIEEFAGLEGKVAALSLGPRIWATRVLTHLDLSTVFDNRLYPGDDPVRKPDLAAFRRVAADFESEPCDGISIGDSERSDILPSREIGMKTIFIGSSKNSADHQAENIRGALKIVRNLLEV